MSKAIISQLKGIVGDQYVLESPLEMEKYIKGSEKPVAIVLPENTAEVSAVVKWANEQNVKITVAGQVADIKGFSKGIVLVMARMNKIMEVDHQNLVVVVEPGMLHKELLEKLTEEGLNFPPEPYEVETSSIGGCFAIGDSDSKSFQFGPTRTYLLGFEMVLPTGEIMDIGNKCIKNVSGYDFIHFAIGSQGTFGIFTKLIVKLLPKPEAKKLVIARFASIHKANSTISTLIKRNIHPTRLNLLNATLAQEVLPGEGQLLMADLEGFTESSKTMANEISAVMTLGGASEVKIIEESGEYENLINGWLKVRGKVKGNPESLLEFSVGPLKLAQALTQLEELTGELGTYPGVVVEGLLGSVNLVLPEGTAKETLAVKINKMAMSLGGNVSGLLGTRLRAESYNDAEMWSETTGLLNEIRSQFDPKGILNPEVNLKA